MSGAEGNKFCLSVSPDHDVLTFRKCFIVYRKVPLIIPELINGRAHIEGESV